MSDAEYDVVLIQLDKADSLNALQKSHLLSYFTRRYWDSYAEAARKEKTL